MPGRDFRVFGIRIGSRKPKLKPELKRISSALGREPASFESFTEWALCSERDAAEEQLYDFIERDQSLHKIMADRGATRDVLKKIYQVLLGAGAGQWVHGHWVPASALASADTLDFILAETDNAKKKTLTLRYPWHSLSSSISKEGKLAVPLWTNRYFVPGALIG